MAIFALAAAAATASLWFQSSQSDQARQFWGTSAAELILRAPQVESLRLRPLAADAAPNGESLPWSGRQLAIVERKDVTQARGLINVRRGLLNDASYDWQATPPLDDTGSPRYALRFRGNQSQAIMLFSLGDHPTGYLWGDGRTVSVRPVAQGLQTFFDEQFAETER